MQRMRFLKCYAEGETKMNRLVVLGALTLLIGCATTSTNDAKTQRLSSDYAPMSVGAWWNYEVSYPGQQGEMKVELLSQKDGYFIDNRRGAFQHTPGGLRDRERYLIKNPIQPGTSWKSVVGPSAVEHLQIDEVGTPCESLAGRFEDCLVVSARLRRDKNMQLHIKWVWARNVGLVRLETEAELPGNKRVRQVTQSLKDYSLSKKAPTDSQTVEKDDGPNTWTQ